VTVYPPIVLEHLETLTDRTGIIQHAIFSIPNRRTGYTTDDNARALIVAIMDYERTGNRSTLRLASTYLSSLHYAQTLSKRFHNFMSFDQVFLDDEGSDDCFGRTMWACGFALAANIHENVKKVARQLFDDAAPWLQALGPLRAKAYALQGCYYYLRENPDSQSIRTHAEMLADQICRAFHENNSPEWEWYEPFLTYSNAVPPRALLLAYQVLGKQEYLDVALGSLEFLTRQTVVDGVLQPIGCNGWHFQGKDRAWFDQQPVDPMASVLCYLAAYDVTHDRRHLELAQISFDWFFGKNILNEPLHDPVTGGCYDALTPSGPNFNQGAESAVACLMAQLAMQPYLDKL
jgi:hypothetical protein